MPVTKVVRSTDIIKQFQTSVELQQEGAVTQIKGFCILCPKHRCSYAIGYRNGIKYECGRAGRFGGAVLVEDEEFRLIGGHRCSEMKVALYGTDYCARFRTRISCFGYLRWDFVKMNRDPGCHQISEVCSIDK